MNHVSCYHVSYIRTSYILIIRPLVHKDLQKGWHKDDIIEHAMYDEGVDKACMLHIIHIIDPLASS